MVSQQEDLIEKSSFLEIAEEIKDNKKYLDLANQLRSEGKFRIIEDRESKEPYLIRYYYYNFRPFARIVIHNVLKSDIDGLHDHPWPWQTYILSGGYYETTPEGRFWRGPGYYTSRKSTDLHRLEVDPSIKEETWTLFMMGPKEKDWGFINEDGTWEQWEEYLNRRKKEKQSNHKQFELSF